MATYAEWEAYWERQESYKRLGSVIGKLEYKDIFSMSANERPMASTIKPGTTITLRRWLNPIGDRMQHVDRKAMAD